MKTILRAFAFSLILTGAVASAHTTNNTAPSVSGKVTMPPVPLCPPDDPTGCDMGK